MPLRISGANGPHSAPWFEKARDDRRIHRVGHAAPSTEQKRTNVGLEALGPDFDDAIDVGLGAGPHLVPGKAGLQVHRQRRAQVRESRIHLAADRSAMRAGNAVIRHQSGVRLDLVQVLGDRQRVPDPCTVVRQARHPNRRREQQQFLARIDVVGRDHHLAELEPDKTGHQPAAQRP